MTASARLRRALAPGDGRLAGALLAAVVLVSLAAPRTAAGQASAVDREVVSLQFEGNRAYSDAQLASAVATGQTRCTSTLFYFPFPFCPLTNWGFAHDRAYLDTRQLAADLLRLRLFYRRRGYRSVRVDTTVERLDGRARVTFRVEEGDPVRVDTLRITGLQEAMAPERARELVPLSSGEPLDLTRLQSGENAIVTRLRDTGYPEAVVLREYFIPTDAPGARVTLDVEPGPRTRIGEVAVTGTRSLSPAVIRQFLDVEEGDLFRQDRISEGQRNLYGLEAVQYANIVSSGMTGSDSLYRLTAEITEAPMRRVRAGGGFTTTDCVQTEGRFVHRNLFGGARRFEASASFSNILARQFQGGLPCPGVSPDTVFQKLNFQFQVNLRQPYFLDGRNRLDASLFLGRESVPGLYVRNTRGGELSVTRRLRPRMNLSLAYRPELTSFGEASADVFFCVNFGFCTPGDIEAITQSRWLSPLRADWRYDRTNAPFSPTDGFYANLEAETAAGVTGSEYPYMRFVVDAADFSEVAGDVVFAVHLRSGLVEPTGRGTFRQEDGVLEAGVEVVHPRKRFFAGGPNSVRGFDQFLLGPTVLLLNANEYCTGATTLEECVPGLAPSAFEERPVGGNALIESSFELRWRTSEDWEVVGFLDVGELAADLGTIEAPVASPGVGVRFFSPVGPLRLDVGYDTSGAEELPVVAEFAQSELLELGFPVRYDPIGHDDPGPATEFFRRLQVHLSIGEAF